MTNDPIIAEIDLADYTDGPRHASIHLSEAPLAEDLLKAAKRTLRDEDISLEADQALFAAIRAIEPEWKP